MHALECIHVSIFPSCSSSNVTKVSVFAGDIKRKITNIFLARHLRLVFAQMQLETSITMAEVEVIQCGQQD